MPKDAKPKQTVRAVRTLSKVAATFTQLKLTATANTVDTAEDADDKLEGSSKYFQSPATAPARLVSCGGFTKAALPPGEDAVALEPDAIALEFLERDTMGASWFDALLGEFDKPYFVKLKKYLATECAAHTIYPSIDNIYSWSRLTPLDSVRVVVLGQDPYHDVGQAHGLSFSVLPPTKPPGSLKNIYKQLKTEYPDFVPPASGDLTPLAAAGVLFLNTSLTVRAHSAASHAGKGWEELTGAALRCVVARPAGQGVVFMAWGLPAQKVLKRIGVDETTHLVLRSAHPSPLSAYRGFLGNGHFRAANEWLEARYGKAGCIDWEVLSAGKRG
ncbi:uracil-DNA glycosylase [Mycena polygramma]|nr:uracil-DNA glycosylase [Mycena polygramma]